MVDFGRSYHDRSLGDLMASKLRPGDIYTHVYSGLAGSWMLRAMPTRPLARPAAGVLFDVGHGGGSLLARAVPIVGEGILPTPSRPTCTSQHEQQHERHA